MHYKSKKVNSNINNSGLPNLQEFFFTHPKLEIQSSERADFESVWFTLKQTHSTVIPGT